jgi:hypothetical protein
MELMRKINVQKGIKDPGIIIAVFLQAGSPYMYPAV